MSGVTLTIQVDDRAFRRWLAGHAERLSDLDDALREMGEVLVPSTQARMTRGVAPDGTSWAPLAPGTLARKKGPGILRESLHLQSSLRYQVAAGALHVGTDVIYAAAQHFGLPAHTIRRKSKAALSWPGARHPVKEVHHPGLKPRPILGLSREDETAIRAILRDYILEG